MAGKGGGAGVYVAAPVPGALTGTPSSIRRSLRMSLRADVYRQKAADAKARAAQAKNRSIKSGFEEVANGWLLLAEQMEWIDRQRSLVRDEENNRSVR